MADIEELAGDEAKEKSDEEREGSTYEEMTSDEERHERGGNNKGKSKKVENTDNIKELEPDWCRAGFQLARTSARNSRGSLQIEKDSNEAAKELGIVETITDEIDKQKDEVGKKTREQATQTGVLNWSEKDEMTDSEKNSEEKMRQVIAKIEERVKTKVEETIMISLEEIKAFTRQETSKIGAQIIRSKCKCKEDQVEEKKRHRQEIERLEKELGKREQSIKEKDRIIKELSEKLKKEKESKTNISYKTKADEGKEGKQHDRRSYDTRRQGKSNSEGRQERGGSRVKETENAWANERDDQEMRDWSLENEVGRFVSEARKRQDKDKTNEEWRRQEEEKLIKEKPKKNNERHSGKTEDNERDRGVGGGRKNGWSVRSREVDKKKSKMGAEQWQ